MNTTNLKKIASTAVATMLLAGIMPLAAMAATPVTTNISPSVILVGSGAISLTVNGSGFDPSAVVNFNGSARATGYVSPNQLTAVISASDLSGVGAFAVTVTNPGAGGGTSNAQTLTVTGPANPIPVMTSVSPMSAMAGGGSFIMTVNGSNFNASSRVRYNGIVKATTLVSPNQLTAIIPASDMAITGQYVVDVLNTAPGGGASGYVLFTVAPLSGAVPTLPNTGFGPTEGSAAAAAVAVTLAGAVAAAFVARRVLSVK